MLIFLSSPVLWAHIDLQKTLCLALRIKTHYWIKTSLLQSFSCIRCTSQWDSSSIILSVGCSPYRTMCVFHPKIFIYFYSLDPCSQIHQNSQWNCWTCHYAEIYHRVHVTWESSYIILSVGFPSYQTICQFHPKDIHIFLWTHAVKLIRTVDETAGVAIMQKYHRIHFQTCNFDYNSLVIGRKCSIMFERSLAIPRLAVLRLTLH
jgi:hypothetical protein